MICEPPEFTEMLEGCRVEFTGVIRFTTALDGKFPPRIVSVKLFSLGDKVGAGRPGGATWVIRGTAFE